MKATNSLPTAPFVLRVVGTILILSALIDYVSVLIPPNFSDKAWFASAVTQIVDRGIIPMVGLGFLLAGSFLQSGSLAVDDRGKPFTTFRFWALLLSLLLGLIYLVVFPLHLNNTRQLSDQALERIDQQAKTTETRLNAEVQQREAQISAALRDPNQAKQLDAQLQQIDAAIASGQLKGDQLEQARRAQKELQALKANPNSVADRAKEFRNAELTKIREERTRAEGQARNEFWKTGVRVGISSLLLSLAYFIIGWVGLKEMGVLSSKRKPVMR
ncbi:hypothetical protein IQ250_13310 [Pseudanabaenaceae cyanobacterium LEGE 13415]|nr:hypothetical protein [Pseudanabaenaceae cyanobacterium LEGE 13415]